MAINISSGVTSGLSVSSNTVNVYSSGKATYAKLYSSAYMYVYSGGSADYTSVFSGARAVVSNGGSASNTRISSGGYLDIRYNSNGAGSYGGVVYSTSVIGGSMTVSGRYGVPPVGPPRDLHPLVVRPAGRTRKSHDGFSARHGRIDLSENSLDYGLKRTQSTSMWLPLRMLT